MNHWKIKNGVDKFYTVLTHVINRYLNGHTILERSKLPYTYDQFTKNGKTTSIMTTLYRRVLRDLLKINLERIRQMSREIDIITFSVLWRRKHLLVVIDLQISYNTIPIFKWLSLNIKKLYEDAKSTVK